MWWNILLAVTLTFWLVSFILPLVLGSIDTRTVRRAERVLPLLPPGEPDGPTRPTLESVAAELNLPLVRDDGTLTTTGVHVAKLGIGAARLLPTQVPMVATKPARPPCLYCAGNREKHQADCRLHRLGSSDFWPNYF